MAVQVTLVAHDTSHGILIIAMPFRAVYLAMLQSMILELLYGNGAGSSYASIAS